ncbi:succinylglutamate desuccinylase/aspartoacylase family protein [Roseomonas aerophila]|uniref:Succinylglutamate desuccinylase/aspartoacylase family protein n=1 Tax=Teichococcus aerophilus TaxID=1224513 RepID=A0ABR7RPY2_9PROT|nr:succinylglutamate desuccinylase/aspartoacylase family protein [Pseudoroseomonas aerophila]
MRLGRDPYLPAFPVRLPIPDLRPWLEGNRLPGVWSFDAPLPGPHVALVSLIHGNEIAGALLLARWLREGLRPLRGRLTFIFGNLAAFARFDPADPTISRFVDEDLNRVWDDRMLAGTRRSTELERARALRPLMDEVDVLLDLHSMLWPSDPLIIAGQAAESRALGLRLGTPPLVVADHGHQTGRRLIDSPAFAERPALLVEGGPHWEETTLETLERCATTLLQEYGLIPPAPAPVTPGRLAEVTRTVIAGTHAFTFVEQFRGGTVIPRRNTLLALDGDQEIRTPHDDCLLIMPSPRALRGHTAIRLARYV